MPKRIPYLLYYVHMISMFFFFFFDFFSSFLQYLKLDSSLNFSPFFSVHKYKSVSESHTLYFGKWWHRRRPSTTIRKSLLIVFFFFFSVIFYFSLYIAPSRFQLYYSLNVFFIPCLFSCLYFCVQRENQINLFALSSEIFFGLRSKCVRMYIRGCANENAVFAIIESYMVVFDLLILCVCVPFLLFASVLFWFISLLVQLQL